MELLDKLEKTILGWTKGLPHLPPVAQKWLGDNVWWIALIGLVLSCIGLLIGLLGLLGGAVVVTVFVPALTSVAVIAGLIGLAFNAAEIALLARAIKPLQLKQKQGWTLLFATWLIAAAAVVVSAVLSLNPFIFIVSIIFGALWLAVSGYFLFEIHGQFARVVKSDGVKNGK